MGRASSRTTDRATRRAAGLRYASGRRRTGPPGRAAHRAAGPCYAPGRRAAPYVGPRAALHARPTTAPPRRWTSGPMDGRCRYIPMDIEARILSLFLRQYRSLYSIPATFQLECWAGNTNPSFVYEGGGLSVAEQPLLTTLTAGANANQWGGDWRLCASVIPMHACSAGYQDLPGRREALHQHSGCVHPGLRW